MWLNVWDSLKSKLCRYLLQRYLGRFLDDKLRLEQLKIELYNGKATIENVSLNVNTLNELFEEQGGAFEVKYGKIGELIVTVPWNALMVNNSSIEVSGLYICLRPVQRQSDGTSMFESMWSSVSSSMQLAEECMNLDIEDISDKNSSMQAIDGLEKFAETIDNVLNRITAKFTNTTIRLEHQLSRSNDHRYISLSIKVKNFNYKNESANEYRTTQQKQQQGSNSSKQNHASDVMLNVEKMRLMSTFTRHNIEANGVQIYTEEYSIEKGLSSSSSSNETCLLPIIEIKGQQKAVIRIKQSEETNGPKILIDLELGGIISLFTPRQIHLILELLKSFNENNIAAENTQQHIAASNAVTCSEYDEDSSKKLGGGFEFSNKKLFDEESNNERNEEIERSIEDKNFSKYTAADRYCNSIDSSMMSSSRQTMSSGATSRLHRKLANIESCGEIVKFNVRALSCALYILYEDIICEEDDHDQSHRTPSESSIRNLCELSQRFFRQFTNDFIEGDRQGICPLQSERNYIFISLAPIVMDGIQQRNKSNLLLKFSGTSTRTNVKEVIKGVAKPLILFERSNNTGGGHQKRAEISFSMKSTSCDSEHHNKVVVDIDIEENILELDISIYDRLSVIICSSPFAAINKDRPPAPPRGYDKSTEINLLCKLLRVNLRLPIVDMVPDRRLPWWNQNVKEDFFQLELCQLRCSCTASSILFSMNSIDISYCENDMSKIHFLKSNLAKNEMKRTGSNDDLLTVNINLKSNEIANTTTTKKNEAANTPFSSKLVCRESDTIHKKSASVQGAETILLPGDKEELKIFRKSTLENSIIDIKIALPNVMLMMHSKQFYEIIYNRLNYNLFLWEPSSPYFEGEGGGEEEEEKTKKESTNRSTSCTIEITVHEGRIICFVPVRNSGDNCVLPEHCGRLDATGNNITIFAAIGFAGNHDLYYTIFEIEKLKIYHCGMIPEAEEEQYTKSFNEHHATTEIPAYMNETILSTPPGLKKSKPSTTTTTNNNRDMISLVVEMRRNSIKRIKRIRVTAGIQGTAWQFKSESSPSCIWINQIIDFLDVEDYITEGYKPYGVLTEMQIHLWDIAIDYKPQNFDYRAVLELGSFSVSSNITYKTNGCNLRCIVEDFVLEIGPYAAQKSNSKSRSPYSSESLVPVLDVGLLDVSVRLCNETSNLCNETSNLCPMFDLRCSIYDANLRTCSDSGKVLAQLIAYIANEGGGGGGDGSLKCPPSNQSPCSQQLSNSAADSGGSDLSLRQAQRRDSQKQERVSSMMADAVKDTNESSSEDTKSRNRGTHADRGMEIFYFPDEETKFNANLNADANLNEYELHDLLNFESNVMINTYNAAAEEDTPLPPVKDDLGEITKNDDESNAAANHTSDDEFCFVSAKDKIFKNVEVLNEPLSIVDNHFTMPLYEPDLLATPETFPVPETRLTICEMTFTWYLYGGTDFLQTPSSNGNNKTATTDNSHSKMSEAYEYGVSYSKNSSNVKMMKGPTTEKLSWKAQGGPKRNHQVLVEIHFSKLRFSHESYATTNSTLASRQVFIVHEIEIRDRLQSSEINKLLYHPNRSSLTKKNLQNMVVIKALHVRTKPHPNSEQECSLRISLLPLRLHIDQDTIIFLIEFLTSIASTPLKGGKDDVEQRSSLIKTDKEQSPVMGVGEDSDVVLLNDDQREEKKPDHSTTEVDEFLMNCDNTNEIKKITAEPNPPEEDAPIFETKPIYFRELIFSPEVSIRLDYHGRRVEFSRGHFAGLLMGLGQLQCSEIRLKKITYRRGILGVEKLLTYMFETWLKDIKKNQLPTILSGVGPTYAVVQLFQGIYDLFWIPIEQFQKDGRIVRGIQLGAQSFTARTALAALEITSRIVYLLQLTAETAFDMVAPGYPIKRYGQQHSSKGKKKRQYRPTDIREGMNNAYIILKEGFSDSAATLIETATIEHDHKGYTGAVGAVMRQIPQLMVCPAVLATQATSNILGGVKNSIVPEAKMEARHKWKGNNEN